MSGAVVYSGGTAHLGSYADGGIAQSPQLAMIAEAGPEIALPFSRLHEIAQTFMPDFSQITSKLHDIQEMISSRLCPTPPSEILVDYPPPTTEPTPTTGLPKIDLSYITERIKDMSTIFNSGTSSTTNIDYPTMKMEPPPSIRPIETTIAPKQERPIIRDIILQVSGRELARIAMEEGMGRARSVGARRR